jgi:hypothetical protein
MGGTQEATFLLGCNHRKECETATIPIPTTLYKKIFAQIFENLLTNPQSCGII